MEKELILTPEELYYLGSFLQAKYIDYAYVAAMGDIKRNYPLFEQETKASLVTSGILTEDFGGSLEIDKSILEILRPIFFGEIETSIDVCYLGETNYVSVNKFHFYDGIATMVAGDNGKLVIKSIDQIAIKDFVTALLPETYDCETKIVQDIDKTKITRFIATKNIVVGKNATVKTYIEADGIIYQETENGIESITRNDFISSVYDIVKGV